MTNNMIYFNIFNMIGQSKCFCSIYPNKQRSNYPLHAAKPDTKYIVAAHAQRNHLRQLRRQFDAIPLFDPRPERHFVAGKRLDRKPGGGKFRRPERRESEQYKESAHG